MMRMTTTLSASSSAQDKPSAKIEYVLGGLENRIFASRYVLYLPEKEALEEEVQAFIEGGEGRK